MSFSENSVNEYIVFQENLVVPDSEGASVTSVNSSTLEEGRDLEAANRKFPVLLEITETCAGNGAFDVKVQVSVDGTNWVDADASLGLDVDPTGSNSGIALADLSNIYAPYIRLQVFSDGTDTQDDAGVRLTVAAPGYRIE